jgi:tetracycline resistance efflux pump
LAVQADQEGMMWLSIIPPLLTILLAIWTKRIIPSLFAGLLVGSMLKAGSFLQGFPAAVDYIINMLSDKGNLAVLLFLYLFSGLVMLVKKSGGIKAFTEKAKGFIESRNGVFYMLWGMVPLTFIDCGFRVVAAGSVIRPLADKMNIARERLAFMLNNTASPVVELIPIATTFVGYNIGIIAQSMSTAGITGRSAYSVLLQSIPLQFFSLVVLPVTFLSIYFSKKKESHTHNEAHRHDKDHGENDKEKMPGMDMKMEADEAVITPRIINLLFPLITIIGFSISLFWINGRQAAGADAGAAEIIAAADPAPTMLLALIISILLTVALYTVQKYPIKQISQHIISGGNDIMHTLAILVLAWPLSSVSRDLGLPELVESTMVNAIPPLLVPVTVFVVTCAVTYFIGSSWGAISLLMPPAAVLAASTGAGIALIVAAVITGATFGDVTSPVSGMTNMSSNIARAQHMQYVRYAGRYNFISAGIAALLFIGAGWLLT